MNRRPHRLGNRCTPRRSDLVLCGASKVNPRRRRIYLRVNSVVMKRSPLVRQTASERIALEIVYPGQSPAPGIGFFASSACRPTYKCVSRLEMARDVVPYMQFQVFDILIQVFGSPVNLWIRIPFLESCVGCKKMRCRSRARLEETARLRPKNFLNSFSEHAPHALPCSIPIISITRRTLGIPRALNEHAADSVAFWR